MVENDGDPPNRAAVCWRSEVNYGAEDIELDGLIQRRPEFGARGQKSSKPASLAFTSLLFDYLACTQTKVTAQPD